MVSDNELEKYVSNIVEFKEVPIKTSKGKLPSNTYFGKLIRNLFHDGCKVTLRCYIMVMYIIYAMEIILNFKWILLMLLI